MIYVRVPATTANLGCGFDCAGLALDISCVCGFERTASGLEFENVDGRFCTPDNPAVEAWYAVMREAGQEGSGLRVRIDSDIPVARGLGSSSALIAAGLTAANAELGGALSLQKLVELGTALEGHPDNIAPALLGGLVISVCDGGRVLCERGEVSPDIRFFALIPPFELLTSRARGVLPDKVPRADAVHELSRAALLPRALEKGDIGMLRFCTDDRLHQPYRKTLIPGWDDIYRAAERCGAAMCLSGAGPTVLIMTDEDELPAAISRAAEGLPEKWEIRKVRVNREGAGTIRT